MPGRKRCQPRCPRRALQACDRLPRARRAACGPRSVLVRAQLVAPPFQPRRCIAFQLFMPILWQTARRPPEERPPPMAKRPLLHSRHVSARGQPGQHPGLAVLWPSWRSGRAVSKGQVPRSSQLRDRERHKEVGTQGETGRHGTDGAVAKLMSYGASGTHVGVST